MEDNEALLEMLTSVTVSKQGSRRLHSSEGRRNKREAVVRDLHLQLSSAKTIIKTSLGITIEDANLYICNNSKFKPVNLT